MYRKFPLRLLGSFVLAAFFTVPVPLGLAADSTSYAPVNIPWQKPSASTADSATYATNAGQAQSASTATTANALCPTCTISGGQVSGAVANATNAANAANAANATYANSSGYANNAGYASSSAAAAIPGCSAWVDTNGTYSTFDPALYGLGCGNGCYSVATTVPNGYVIGSSGYSPNICVAGTWASISVPEPNISSPNSGY